MTNDIEVIDPCRSDEWLQFVSTHPDAGIFHHPAWLTMLRDIYGYKIFALCLKDGNTISAGIPFADVRSFITGNRWISLPFSDHCQPLLPGNNPDTVKAAMQYLAAKQGSETPKIEIRWEIDYPSEVFYQRELVIHELDLKGKGETETLKSFNQQAQRSIKKGEKEKVVVKECKTFEEFESFYHLQILTRKRLGVPAQPKSFFKGVWDYILKPGLGFALVVFNQDRAVGGGVFFTFNGKTSYKYGASDMAFKSLQPNYVFMWNGIKRAIADGSTTFDFGRSDKDNDGLRRFKLGWGTVERELAYTIFADQPPDFGPSKLHNIVGKVIRNSPQFVCTMTGQLLYKHFA